LRPWSVAQPLLPLLLWPWLRQRQGGALQAAAVRSRQQARLPVCRGFSPAAMRSWPRGYVSVPQVVGRGHRFALQNGPSGAPIWPVWHCSMGRFGRPKGLRHVAGRGVSPIFTASLAQRFRGHGVAGSRG